MYSRRYCLIFACVFATLLVTGCVGSRAGQSLRQGDYNRAIFEYDHELRQNPGNSRVAVLRGFALYRAERYQECYDSLLALAEQEYRVRGFATFWAGLAALCMEDGEKLTQAWALWSKQDALDYESLGVFRYWQAELTGRDLTGFAHLAAQVEADMSAAYAKDEYVRHRMNSRRTQFMGDTYYDHLVPLRSTLYLP